MYTNNNFDSDSKQEKKDQVCNVDFSCFFEGSGNERYSDISKLEAEGYWKWYNSQDRTINRGNVQPVPSRYYEMIRKSASSQNTESNSEESAETDRMDTSLQSAQQVVVKIESKSSEITEVLTEDYYMDPFYEGEEQASVQEEADELLSIEKNQTEIVEEKIVEEDKVREENAVMEEEKTEQQDIAERLEVTTSTYQMTGDEKKEIVDKEIVALLRKLVGTEVNQVLFLKDIYDHFQKEYNHSEKDVSKQYISKRMSAIAKKYNIRSARVYTDDTKRRLSSYTGFQKLLDDVES